MFEQFKNTFRLLKKWWMTFAHAVGWFNTRLLLTLAYVFIFALPALYLKLIRKDLLNRKFNNSTSYWIDKEKVLHTAEQAKRQF